MKKVISLTLALVLALSMATIAFALPSAFDGKDAPDSGAMLDATGNTLWILPGESYDLTVEKFQLVGGSALAPTDMTYFSDEYFTISKIEYEKGKDLIESVKFDKDGNLVVTAKANAKLSAPSIANSGIKNITLTAKKDTGIANVTKGKKLELAAKNLSIFVGYRTKEVGIEGSDFTPVLTENTITKFVNGGADYGIATLSFFSGDITVEGRVYKNEIFNFATDSKANIDVVKANPDAELTFFSFNGAAEFSQNATVSISAEKDSFIYEIKGGKLIKTNFKWDADVDNFVGKTKTLGSYVVSDVELKAIAASTDKPDDAKNPNTGANDVVGVAVALAVVSLVAAGAISLKK